MKHFSGVISNYLDSRKRTELHHTVDDRVVLNTAQDIRDVVETNKARYAQVDERARWGKGDMVASIPLVVWQELIRKGIAYDNDALLAWLDDPDNSIFRTRPGRLSK